MMKHGRYLKLFGLCLVATAAALLGASCAQPTSAVAKSSSSTGSLTITIPAFAPWLQSLAAESKNGGASKAMAIADKATVTVKDGSGNNVVDPVSSSVSSSCWGNFLNNDNTKPWTYSGGLTLSVPYVPEGSGYTVALSVYNTNVSTTTPVVEGSLGAVSVTKQATTNISIVCKPVSPTALSLSTPMAGNLNKTCEQWYSLSVSSGTTYYVYLTDNTSLLSMAVFDPAGTVAHSATNGDLWTGGGYLEYTPSSSGTAYVALANNWYDGSTSKSYTLNLSSTKPVLSEGTTVAPVDLGSIASGSSSSFTFKFGSWGYGTWPTNQETSYYKFKTSAAGDYAFDSASSASNFMYFASLYTDPSFVGQVNLGNLQYLGDISTLLGGIFRGLAANTTYYLKIDSNMSYTGGFTGTIIPPDALVATAKANDGSYAAPQAITIGTPFAGKIGYHGYDKESYYSFKADKTTATVTFAPQSGQLNIGVYTSSDYTGCLGVNSANSTQSCTLNLSGLTINNYYYLKVTKSSESDLTNISYSLSVSD
jgi:hypothetical protein